MPKISDRKPVDQWLKDHGKDIRFRAREKAKEILLTHHPEPLDRDLEHRLDEFIDAAAKRDRRSIS
jgi:trimethylamine:corrinoid methyltransferase-like protein